MCYFRRTKPLLADSKTNYYKILLMTITRLILKNLKKCRKLFILFCLAFLLTCIILPLEGWIVSRLVGCFEIEDKMQALQNCLIIMQTIIAYYLLRALINGFFASYIKEAFSYTFISYLIADIFASVHAHSVRYFDDEMSGRISAAVNGFARGLVSAFTNTCYMLIRPLCTLIVSFAIIAAFSPALSLSLLALNIPYFFAVYKVNRRFFTLSNDRTKAENKASGILVDSIANAGLVKYSGSFFTEQLYFYKHLKQAYRLHAAQGKYQTFSRFAFHAADTVFLSVSILLILFFAKRDNIALDNLFYVYTTLSGMVLSIMLINNFSQFSASLFGSLKANFDIINLPPDISEKENAKTLHASKASITFQNVSFSYVKDRPVFQNLNLKIEPGQKIGLVGHSGSGKSTCMNIIGCLDVPTHGTYRLNGRDVGRMNRNELASVRNEMLGFIFQQYNLLPKLNLMENVEVPLVYAGIPRAERHRRARAVLEQVGLGDKIRNKPNQLSGGQQQRVSIARALVRNPAVILADEPTGALDSHTSREVLGMLQDLHKQGNTVVLITHDNSIAVQADRIIRLEDGQVVYDGDSRAPEAIVQPTLNFEPAEQEGNK